MYISLVAAVVSVLMLCGAEFTTIFGVGNTSKILAALGIANALVNGINGVLHMIPSQTNTQFPLGPTVSAAAKVAALFLAVSVSLLLLSPPAQAQAPKKTTVAAAKTNPVLAIQTFTVADLQAALTDAQAQTPPDATAAACYSALIPIVQSGVANPLPKGLGAFQALQKARDFKAMLANLQSPNGPLAALNTACAPLIVDTQTTLIQLGIIGGGVVATAPLALPLLALPAGL
jgi:hypothetical protein